ncbi:hypothetical protein F0562_002418 [Nyssa sinensis]|uniref:C2H2-type domain-containing protein n=1 Tax=Nyssa sinensis TaxID=561372 RepID=A0A5J5C7A6_9ASTE|nr:hypothetical protein F0562_002418 [Nyssa sinensis]
MSGKGMILRSPTTTLKTAQEISLSPSMEEGYDSTSDLDEECPPEVTPKGPPPAPFRRFVYRCMRCHLAFGTRMLLQDHSQVHFGQSTTNRRVVKSQQHKGSCCSSRATANQRPAMKSSKLNVLPDTLKLTLAPPCPPWEQPSLELTLGSGTGTSSGFVDHFKTNENKMKASGSNTNSAGYDNSDLNLKLSPPWKLA